MPMQLDDLLLGVGIFAALGLWSAFSLARIKRTLREFAYLDADDPAAYHALVEAHRPQAQRCVISMVAAVVAILAAVLVYVVDWRERVGEADRYDRLGSSAPATPVWQERVIPFRRYRVFDGDRTLRIYYRAAGGECLLSRVDVQEYADDVRVTVFVGLIASPGPWGSTFGSCQVYGGDEPNRYVDVRLAGPLGRRTVHSGGDGRTERVTRELFAAAVHGYFLSSKARSSVRPEMPSLA
jgi:hypothetical protein